MTALIVANCVIAMYVNSRLLYANTIVETVSGAKKPIRTQSTYGKDSVNILRKSRVKALSLEDRFIYARSKLFKALLRAENDTNIQETVFYLQELLDAYIDLVRLKLATRKLND